MNAIPNLEELREGAVLLIDKPLGWTSFQAINKIKTTIHTKIGHAGTLDPLASGLLICCTEKKTKELESYQKQIKEYTGIIQLGAVTPTFDLESIPEKHKDFQHITESEIEKIKEKFLGTIQQYPPIHSAIKQDGKPIYLKARAGKEVIVEPREVTIYSFDTSLKEDGNIHFKVVCSTGTYIRSLANDFGAALGVGGYLKSLRRTKIGNFSVENAHNILSLAAIFSTYGAVRQPKVKPKKKKDII